MPKIELERKPFWEFVEHPSEQGWLACPETAHIGRKFHRERVVKNWQERAVHVIGTITIEMQLWTCVQRLQMEIVSLKKRCTTLEEISPIVVAVQTLSPEPYELVRPLQVVVRSENEQYIASFFDANLSASGDTRHEAVVNLKDVIIGAFEILTMTDESKLGPGPAQQRTILEEFIRKKV